MPVPIFRGKGRLLLPDMGRRALTHSYNGNSQGPNDLMPMTYFTCVSQKLSPASKPC